LLADAKAIYVFRNGTCVYSNELMPEADAVEIMKEHGPVQVGTPAGDFHVAAVELPLPGFVLKYSHPQLVSFISNEECPSDCPEHLVGFMVRLGRDMDSRDLYIVASNVQET